MLNSTSEEQNLIAVARVQGAFGVLGWMRIHCLIDDEIDSWINADPWLVADQQQQLNRYHLTEYKWHSGNLIVKLDKINDRNQAEKMRAHTVLFPRNLLAPTKKGQYYWADLIGLTVFNSSDENLGIVEKLLETGSNDVLQIKDQLGVIRLIPFADVYIKQVDLASGKIIVDWQLDW